MDHNYAGNGYSVEGFQVILRDILSWWANEMPDNQNGGFLAKIGGDGTRFPMSEKGVVLNTRILWTFSKAINNDFHQYRFTADRAYHFISRYFIDQENGGLYWMLNHRGIPTNPRKQIYAQAFGIYSFTEYYLATGSEKALEKALALFEFLENVAYDKRKDGYLEAFSRDWSPIEDLRLSVKDANNSKTMNTHLHILEAYTNLYRCLPSLEVRTTLIRLIHIYCDRFIDLNNGRLKLFFDDDWNENMTHHSFGHEIESAWLLNESAKIIGDVDLIDHVGKYALALAKRVLSEGQSKSGGIYNERYLNGDYDKNQDWWPQAEAVVGFYDAYQLTKNDEFLAASKNCLKYIMDNFIDHKNGEWYWSVGLDGKPNLHEEKAGPWKAPYHNSRMCFEMIARLNNMSL